MESAIETIGTRRVLDQGQILELIGVQAGFLAQIYGKIKNGKTYLATLMAIEFAEAGQVVYTNWPIAWNGYDERDHFKFRLLGLLGIKKDFYVYPKTNLHFCDLSNLNDVKVDEVSTGKNFYDWFRTLTSCTVMLDEGHIYYDSYMALKMKIEDRLPILETAHYDRTVVIVSQRASAIHAVLRGNVNIFYKVEKLREAWWFFKTKFRRVEFQDTGADEKPNEERETIIDPETGRKEYGEYLFAESIKYFKGEKKIYQIYDSKYRRLGAHESQNNNAEIYTVNWRELWPWSRKKKHAQNIPKPTEAYLRMEEIRSSMKASDRK